MQNTFARQTKKLKINSESFFARKVMAEIYGTIGFVEIYLQREGKNQWRLIFLFGNSCMFAKVKSILQGQEREREREF